MKIAANWLREVDLEDRGTHRPGELSGGEQQRVALARALVCSPRLLLADEPTGDLDGTTAGRVFELIERLHASHGLTSILVTHNMELAATLYADSSPRKRKADGAHRRRAACILTCNPIAELHHFPRFVESYKLQPAKGFPQAGCERSGWKSAGQSEAGGRQGLKRETQDHPKELFGAWVLISWSLRRRSNGKGARLRAEAGRITGRPLRRAAWMKPG